MGTLLEKLEQGALSLPAEPLAFLADSLLSSLSGKVLSDGDAAWITEAEHRYRKLKEGKRTAAPASEVFADADRLLK